MFPFPFTGITWHLLHVLDHSMYWRAPHYDYIPLPLGARTRYTRFRWWQLEEGNDPDQRPVSWAIDDVYIGGREINAAHMQDDFNGWYTELVIDLIFKKPNS